MRDKMSQNIKSTTEDVRIRYFAYGSNMLRSRMESRVRGLRKECIAYVPDFRLRANKKGDDGSSKANIEPFRDERVWGVVWSLPTDEIGGLDRAEGYSPEREKNHYEPQGVFVYDVDGVPWETMTYIACEGRTTEEDFPLFTWYHGYLIPGAKEHGLTMEYVDKINLIPKIEDGDKKRHNRNMRIMMDL